MKVNFTVTGGAELAKQLRQLPTAVGARTQRAALIAGAEPIRREASQLAPRGAGAGPHLADDIVIGVVSARRLESQDRGSQTVVEVGPSLRPADHFYGFFQEFGTVRHRARPFMRPAFDNQARTSLGIALQYLWNSITLFNARMFRAQASETGARLGSTPNLGGRNL